MYFKRIMLLSFVCSFTFSNAQENDTLPKKDYGRVYGGFETNGQWYLNDKERGRAQPNDPLRSNSYLFVNYQIGKWTAGVQVESYLKEALLNYNPDFTGVNLGTYFLNYKTNKLDVTAGHFYEQFGSGMILRAWESRNLGINTAIMGGRVIYRPISDVKLTALYGQQRSGFRVSDGKIFGFDSEFQLTNALKFEKSDLSLGLSYVGRYEKTDIPDPNFNELTNAYSARLNYSYDAFYSSIEYNYKSEDAIIDRISNQIKNDFVRSGNALLFNLGYSKQGLGIDATFRRTENMLFLSERVPTPIAALDINGLPTTKLSSEFSDKVLNFTPALTKQHHSLLANIYVYQAQVGVEFKSNQILKAGETGGQIDVFYEFAKETPLGGKYGTKLSLNAASWYNLPGQYRATPADYETNLFGVGTRYYTDYNLEIKKKVSEKLHTGFTYINQFYNKRWVEDQPVEVNTNIVAAEFTYNFQENKSIRFEGEHLWADTDFKNWVGGTLELDLNNKYSFFILDVYNYGNDDINERTHYYNCGGAYRINSTRIGLSYGRQRGGLVCVGGVCRVVPPSSGIGLSVSTSF
jgi:hypothetical protein